MKREWKQVRTREKWIDNAKGIAIILVILGHTSNLFFVNGIHLVMFFLLSGYTLKKREVTREYINGKFRRLMIPYFCTCLAVLVTDIWNNCIVNHDVSFISAARITGTDLLRSFFASGLITSFGNLELGTRIGAIWFLPALFFSLLIVQIVLQKTKTISDAGICTGIIAILGYISARFIWFPFSIQSSMLASFFIWIGYAIRERQILLKLKWQHYLIAQVIFLFGIFEGYSNIGFVLAFTTDIILSLIVGLSGCLLIYFFSKQLYREVLLAWIGKNSLTIMCMHLYEMETMGYYFDRILDRLQLEGDFRAAAFVLIEILFPIGTTIILLFCKKLFERLAGVWGRKETFGKNWKGCLPIDAAQGIFICSVLIGYFADDTLRQIIYSCHAAAFIFFSGFYYQEYSAPKDFIRKMVKNLALPYVLTATCILIINCISGSGNWQFIIRKYLMANSFTSRYFTDVESVGPIYFIPMLLAVNILYFLVDKAIKKETYILLTVIAFSVAGVKMGQKGVWLPWSMDIAFYGLLYYWAGVQSRKYGVLQKISDLHLWYFILVSIWAFMIYEGGMEFAIRNYGNFGVTIIGALAGIMTVYKLCVYFKDELPLLSVILGYIGKAAVFVLILHTVLERRIGEFIFKFVGRSDSIKYVIIVIGVQILLAVFVLQVWNRCLDIVNQIKLYKQPRKK